MFQYNQPICKDLFLANCLTPLQTALYWGQEGERRVGESSRNSGKSQVNMCLASGFQPVEEWHTCDQVRVLEPGPRIRCHSGITVNLVRLDQGAIVTDVLMALFLKCWQNSEWNICSDLVIIANSRLWVDECWFRFSLCVFFCMLSFPHRNCYKLLLFLFNALVCFISNFYIFLYFF